MMDILEINEVLARTDMLAWHKTLFELKKFPCYAGIKEYRRRNDPGQIYLVYINDVKYFGVVCSYCASKWVTENKGTLIKLSEEELIKIRFLFQASQC